MLYSFTAILNAVKYNGSKSKCFQALNLADKIKALLLSRQEAISSHFVGSQSSKAKKSLRSDLNG
jgi:hypothetical protein